MLTNLLRVQTPEIAKFNPTTHIHLWNENKKKWEGVELGDEHDDEEEQKEEDEEEEKKKEEAEIIEI